MSLHAFRLVNVFAGHTLGGNPLCVFEDGRDLDAATMQALALQFNLSETTFLLPSANATARVRIFTPAFEMPFAGHPTLGSAHVLRALRRAAGTPGDSVTLEMTAGIVPVSANDDVWTLEARPPRHRAPAASRESLTAMLGLATADLADAPPLWVDAGSEQLVIPLASFAAVERARPDAHAMHAACGDGSRAMAYVFARDGERVRCRFFFPKHGAVIEDPGTGSACANLGGWLLATGAPLPVRLALEQGDQVGRPCRLGLEVSAEGRIRVSGRVIEVARGAFTL
jgi:PhzF family phenazine biosynthesis protein